MSEQGTLDWCHAQFMAEPYPGHWNHIANILNPNARRMGVGIATGMSELYVTSGTFFTLSHKTLLGVLAWNLAVYVFMLPGMLAAFTTLA